MIPSLAGMLVMFVLLRPYLNDLKNDKTDEAGGAGSVTSDDMQKEARA